MPKYNPFRPGSKVSPGMLAGRFDEIKTLEKTLFQTLNGNPENFLIQGERGIGKSSLLLTIQWIADGSVSSMEGITYNFLVVNTELEPNNTYTDIIQKVGSELNRQLKTHAKTKELIKKGWEFLSRWEILGVKYASQSEAAVPPHQLLEDLTQTIAQTLAQLVGNIGGLLITIDEADKPPASAHLGEFIKLLTERLTTRGCNNVSVGLAGLPTVVRKLRESHESSLRTLKDIPLKPLQPDERTGVIDHALKQAEQKNGFKTAITAEAKDWISQLSEGYPHFIQQFGHCAFDADSDNEIDLADVVKGAFGKNGAIHQLGVHYFNDPYFEQINSDEYRKVLRFMADHLDGWVTKLQIRKAVSLKETTLRNAIAALSHKHLIIAKQGTKGVYRLQSRSFAVWIKALTTTNPQQPQLPFTSTDAPSTTTPSATLAAPQPPDTSPKTGE